MGALRLTLTHRAAPHLTDNEQPPVTHEIPGLEAAEVRVCPPRCIPKLQTAAAALSCGGYRRRQDFLRDESDALSLHIPIQNGTPLSLTGPLCSSGRRAAPDDSRGRKALRLPLVPVKGPSGRA
ncbi:hypothetical protein E2C01_013988 [Portunus trituberculatus]|uniref:Uncharacterized protein n=1 Tax=Portunus trituberculatus TaxID=210409 RepID=A0A5B7DIQ5_PORTR|nr:hypothetical protein [Portunus trituberculatus]